MRIYILIQGESHQTYFSVKFKFSKGLEYNFSVKNKHIIILVHSPYKVSKTKHFRKINATKPSLECIISVNKLEILFLHINKWKRSLRSFKRHY